MNEMMHFAIVILSTGIIIPSVHGQQTNPLSAENLPLSIDHNPGMTSPELDTDWSNFESDWQALEDLRVRPVNINCMQASELERLYWLTPFQIQSIQEYVEKTGSIRSIFEIPYIHGFTSKDMETLCPYVCFLKKGSLQPSKWKTETKSIIESSGRLRNQIKVEQTSGHSSQIKLLWISPMNQNVHIKQLGGSLEWRGSNYIKQVIIGDFGTKWGQGLIVHQGVFKNLSSPVSQLPSTYRSQALSQDPTYPHYRGISLTTTLGTLQTDLAYSFQDSLQGLARIAWKNHRIACAFQCRTNLSSGSFSYSTDVHLNFDHHQIFTELAIVNKKFAGIFGYLYQPIYQHKTGILINYSPISCSAEWLYEYQWNVWNLQFALERKFWRTFRYRVSMPCEETLQKAHLSYQSGLFRLHWRWSKRADNLNVKNDLNIPSVLPFTKERHRFQLEWELSSHLQINTEYQHCVNQSEKNITYGHALAQSIHTKDVSGKWNVRLVWAWYLSDDFDTALYIFETNYLNRFSIPVLYGYGLRYNAQFAYTPKPNQLYTVECIYQDKWKFMAGVRIRWGVYSSLSRISRTLN